MCPLPLFGYQDVGHGGDTRTVGVQPVGARRFWWWWVGLALKYSSTTSIIRVMAERPSQIETKRVPTCIIARIMVLTAVGDRLEQRISTLRKMMNRYPT